ncbi:hypothetical protein M0805_004732 [Coniferiporia weirii]|nr:hypothetical protein M0805_004732 [Coniferiporia weirii]
MLASSSSRLVANVSKRGLHDLVTTPSRKPIISYGPPGRSAVTGHTVTVFGCTGFLGRYLVSKIAKSGTQVIVPYRDEDEKRHLKVMGDLGQIVPLEWDIRNEQQIAECLRHSDTVYSLVGRNFETKNFDFHAVNAKGPATIAKVAAEHGVENFVHVSHLNASPDSTSQFYATKFEGEQLVKEAFPNATIVRPGSLFGYEDRLLNNMTMWPIWWKLNYGQTKIRPVHVMDVAQALTNLLTMPSVSRTLSLPGPSTLTHAYLLELISAVTYNPPSKAPALPKRLALLLAKGSGAVWWPTVCPDEVERRFIDDAETPGDWDAVDIVPDEIEMYALKYLRRFRSADNFLRPVVLPEGRPYTIAHLLLPPSIRTMTSNESRDEEITEALLGPSGSPPLKTAPQTEDNSEASSSSSSDSSSDSDASSSDPDSDSDSDLDSEFGEVSQEYLDSLLEKARASMRAKAGGKGKEKEAFGADEIRLENGRNEFPADGELPQLDPGKLPPGYFDFDANSNQETPPVLRDVEAEKLEAASTSVPAAPLPPPELARDGKMLTKKERKAQKQKSAKPGWFDLPTPDAADLPRLHREVEALRLRNSLDPKRFYRKEAGEGKGVEGLPKQFAIGTIIPTSTPFGTASGENLTRAQRKRTLVDELVDDSEAKRYAKKKFESLQTVRGARGRGTLAKRNATRKPKW